MFLKKLLQSTAFTLLLPGLLTPVLSQDSAYARHIIRELSSHKLQGRGYVNGGQQKAASFLRREFRQIGLLPLAGGYYQEFRFPVNVFPGRMSLSINDLTLKAGRDFLVDPASGSLRGSFRIVAQDTARVLHAYPVKHLQTGPGEPGSTGGLLTNAGSIVLHGPDGSPAGTIRVTTSKLTWSVATNQDKKAGISLLLPDSLRVETLKLNIDSKLTLSESRNVIGIIPGTACPDSLIVFTAHYDHLGMMGKKVYFPGANDNASGVALMLDLARYYAAHPPRYTLVFLAIAGEEAGLLGSLWFSSHPLVDLKKVRFLLNLDLAGTGSDGIMVVNASIFRKEFELLQVINKSKSYLPAVKSRGEACNSDHCPFYRKGVACFFIYTMGGITAYHDIFDRCETLPLDGYMGYCRLMLDFTQALQTMP